MDKKIYIDGVDVSGCEHYRAEIETKMPYGEYEIQKDKCHYSGIEIIQNCKGNKGCIYKQLKRLEQKNERLKEELRNNSDVLIHEMGLKDEYQSDYVFEKLERQKYKQALEDIRDMIAKPYCCKPQDVIAKINEVIGAEE